MKNEKFDLNKAKEILNFLAGGSQSFAPRTGLEIKSYLFFFKRKYHLIESGKYRKLSESEVRLTLETYPETKIYFMCSDNTICPMPQTLEGKDKQAVQVKDDQAVIDYIKKVSGVEIKKSEI